MQAIWEIGLRQTGDEVEHVMAKATSGLEGVLVVLDAAPLWIARLVETGKLRRGNAVADDRAERTRMDHEHLMRGEEMIHSR